MSISSRQSQSILAGAAPGLFAGGAVYGLALARYLYESAPWRCAFLGGWPGVSLAVLALLGGLAALGAGRLLVEVPRRGVSTARADIPWAAPLALLLPLAGLLAPEVDLLRLQVLLLAAPLACAAALRPPRPALAAPGLFLLLLALYLRTLAPAVGEADTFEFQVGIARLGIAHGSGYPLLMLAGKFFTLLPLGGTLAWRANLTSAFFGALAGVGVERLARRLGAGAAPAFLAGLLFGVSPSLWSRAVEVEAYTLNAALVASLLNLALQPAPPQPARKTETGSEPSAPHTTNRLYLYLCPFLFGLSLTNHLTTLLLAPALIVARWGATTQPGAAGNSGNGDARLRSAQSLIPISGFFSRGRGPGKQALSEIGGARAGAGPANGYQRGLKLILWNLGLCLLGLSVYLYLPLRWPAVNNGELLSWAQLANLLTGGEARGALNLSLIFADAGRYAIVGRKLVAEYGWAGPALALVGWASLVWPGRRWRAALALALAGAGYFAFALAFNVPDPDFSAFLIPIHLITAALMGAGLEAAGRLAAQARMPASLKSFLPALMLTAAGLLPLRSIWVTLPRVDQSQDWEQQRLGEYMLAQPLAETATLLVDSQKIAPLYYLQVAEGRRPDLDIVVLPDEASYRDALDERMAQGRAVYLGRYLPGLGGAYSLRSVGPLAEVSNSPFLSPAPDAAPLDRRLVSGIELTGYTAEREVAAPGPLYLTLHWHAPGPVDGHYLVSLRLVDSLGRTAWQSAGRVPVGGLYPTNAWRPGEYISDFYSLPLGADLAPGTYTLEAGVFPPFQVRADTGWVEVAPVRVLPPARPPQPAQPARARFGGASAAYLLGYDAPESSAPGAPVPVTLYWLRGPGQNSVTAFGETRSLAAWPAGQAAPLTYRLAAPESGERLELWVETGETARCGWLSAPARGCALRPVQLAGVAVAEGAYNFDQQLVLAAASLDTPEASPGGLAQVTLRWQGLRAMSEDYTVFVHLLGPDGRVHGQVDAWPVSGTRPTSGWQPGEVIEDRYQVRLPEDAPPGAYQVEVGLYLLATLERLPVLNADGQAVDDRVLIDGLSVR